MGRSRDVVLVGMGMVILIVAAAVRADGVTDRAPTATPPTLAGRLLVATEQITDPRFARTVIYLVRHDEHGAMGVVVNRAVGEIPLAEVLALFGVRDEPAHGTIRVRFGGPVQPTMGSVLHTSDWSGDGTIAGAGGIAFTASSEVLRAHAKGKGPQRLLLLLGYAGWAPGQLEAEIERKDWITVSADAALVFSDDDAAKWERARAREVIRL